MVDVRFRTVTGAWRVSRRTCGHVASLWVLALGLGIGVLELLALQNIIPLAKLALDLDLPVTTSRCQEGVRKGAGHDDDEEEGLPFSLSLLEKISRAPARFSCSLLVCSRAAARRCPLLICTTANMLLLSYCYTSATVLLEYYYERSGRSVLPSTLHFEPSTLDPRPSPLDATWPLSARISSISCRGTRAMVRYTCGIAGQQRWQQQPQR